MRWSEVLLLHFVEYAGVFVLPLLLFGILVSILVTGLAPRTSHRVQQLAYGALGLGLALSAVWLVLYAAGPDTYYEPTEVTRWEHADRWGKTPIVVAAIGAAAISSVVLLVTAASKTRESLRLLAGASGCRVVRTARRCVVLPDGRSLKVAAKLFVIAGYLAVALVFIYGVADQDWNIPAALVLFGLIAAQVAAGFVLRWWGLLLPAAAVVLAIPAGWSDMDGEPILPVWGAVLLGWVFAIPLIIAGVLANIYLRRLRAARVQSPG